MQKRLVVLFVFMLLGFSQVSAQTCPLTDTLRIGVTPSVFYDFHVGGAINNDLASPTQGICRINIRFLHNYLGEITMRLHSPSGQVLTLIGSNGSFGYTVSTKWDISLIPCSEAANPRAGFSARWENNQAWGSFGSYLGESYYPNGGCFEEFTGSVDGTWRLEIEDNVSFNTGFLEYFEIVFCDGTGVNCLLCMAEGGGFSRTNYTYCSSDLLDLDYFDPYSIVAEPDTSTYTYEYVQVIQGLITNIDKNVAVFDYSIDSKICGLSVSKRDLNYINTEYTGKAYSKLENDLFNSMSLCADLSDNCIDMKIRIALDTLLIDTSLCMGEMFSFRGTDYPIDGEYDVPLDQSCDSVAILLLKYINVDASIQTSSTILACSNSSITLKANPPTDGSYIYIWKKENSNGGTTALSSKVDSLVVNASGVYHVIITNGSCVDSASVSIIQDNTGINLNIVSDSLTCDVLAVNPVINTSETIRSYEWTGPNSYNSNLATPNIIKAGNYNLIVTAENGCTAQAMFNVKQNIMPPIVDFIIDTIDCLSPEIIIQDAGRQIYKSVEWTGPGDFMSTDLSPRVSVEGEYKVIVSGGNGCLDSAMYEIISMPNSLSFSLNANPITCLEPQVSIELTSMNVIEKYIWENSSGIISTTSTYQASQGGEYYLTAYDNVGCFRKDSIVIVVDTLVPFTIMGSDIGCAENKTKLSILFDSDSITVANWMLPDGEINSQSTIEVSEAGLYRVNVEGVNGCERLDSFEVKKTDGIIGVELMAEDITCTTDSIQIISTGSTTYKYVWQGPDFVSLQESPFVKRVGTYSVIVTDEMGICKDTLSIEVKENKEYPQTSILVPQVQKCVIEKEILNLSNQDPNWIYSWYTMDGLIGGEKNKSMVEIDMQGQYIVDVTDNVTQCVTSDTIEVSALASPLSWDLETSKLSCMSDSFDIEINSIMGNSGVISYFLNGQSIMQNQLLALPFGEYKISVVDTALCTLDTIVSLFALEDISINLNDEYYVNEGEDIELAVIETEDLPRVDSMIWYINDEEVSQDVVLDYSYDEDSELRITVFYDNGCVAEKLSKINIIEPEFYFIPNVFTPGNSDMNATFSPSFSNGITKVLVFRILDRWGNILFEKLDFDPNNSKYEWDGSFNNQEMQSGVFLVELHFILNTQETKKIMKNITIIR